MTRRQFISMTGTVVGTIAAATVDIASGATAPTNILSSAQKITADLCTVLDWMFYLLMVLAVAMTLVAGYMYATSNGDEEKVHTATKTLTYVSIAVVVAILAKGVPLMIANFFGPQVGGSVSGVCQ